MIYIDTIGLALMGLALVSLFIRRIQIAGCVSGALAGLLYLGRDFARDTTWWMYALDAFVIAAWITSLALNLMHRSTEPCDS